MYMKPSEFRSDGGVMRSDRMKADDMASAPEAIKKQYREGMARLGAALNVITTDGPGGRAAFAASAVCSVTDTPPTLLVCANRTNDSYPAMKANAVLCVNTLASAHEELSPVFAGMTDHTMEARFDGATWHGLATGAPILDGALVE